MDFNEQRKTVSIQGAQRLCGVSRRTIYNWLSANKIEYIRTAGGAVRIFTDSLFKQPTQWSADQNKAKTNNPPSTRVAAGN